MSRKGGRDASAKGGEDDQECRRKCWTSSQSLKANDVEGRQILKKEEEDAKLQERCEAKKRSKYWQRNEEMQNMQTSHGGMRSFKLM